MNKVKVRSELNNKHDSVGKAQRTANQGHVTANSHALSSSFDPGYIVTTQKSDCTGGVALSV
jgi:hypothetical protein